MNQAYRDRRAEWLLEKAYPCVLAEWQRSKDREYYRTRKARNRMVAKER